jgi:hypothetical protein
LYYDLSSGFLAFLALLFGGGLALGLGVVEGGYWLTARRERQARGRCEICNDDLRASQNRCPECGTPMSPQNKAIASQFRVNPQRNCETSK